MFTGNISFQNKVPLMDESVINWLMEGDPAIRWQVMRDLLDREKREVEAERQNVAVSGWGGQLLALQEPSGRWGGGIYSPKWVSTHYTLLTLRQLGLPPQDLQAKKACELLLESGYYKDGGINYFPKSQKYSETCITGMLLNLLAYFHFQDERLDHIAAYLFGQQMEDGGWNCESYRGAKHSSFHTTMSVLEGLRAYQKLKEAEIGRNVIDAVINEAQGRGGEFLLAHRLFRSHRTGEIIDERMLRFPFPPRWRYDILRALDYFRELGEGSKGRRRDERMREAIEVVIKKRLSDGRWPAHTGMSGQVYFILEKAGQPGRWTTLRALRVLKWWEAGS